MTARDDGGPAFPEAVAVGPAGDVYEAAPGMSLRDWFAGQALAGIASKIDAKTVADLGTGVIGGKFIAAAAYALADAMLAARKVRP